MWMCERLAFGRVAVCKILTDDVADEPVPNLAVYRLGRAGRGASGSIMASNMASE